MIDVTRAQVVKKNKPEIKSSEKHPDIPVLQFLAVAEKGKKTIKLNRCAFDLLNVNEQHNNLVLFENYSIAEKGETPTPEQLISVIGVVPNEGVSLPKGTKTYEIALQTRNVKSKALHEFVMEYFGLNEKENNYIELVSVGGEAYSMNVLNEVFDKGSEILIEEAPMNAENQA